MTRRATRGLPLSPREMQVITLLDLGKKNAEIADELGLKYNTVRTYIQRICQKLEAANRTHAVHRARVLGVYPEKTGGE